MTPYPLLLATTVVGVVLPTAACSRQAPVRSIGNAEPAPELTPCRDTKPEHHLLCGHLSVPEDRSKPGGRRIELNVVVLPASQTPRQPDPIFWFGGGPGDQSTPSAPFWTGLPFGRNRDIVLVDQRGTRGSGSLYCEDLDDPPDLTMPPYYLPAVERCRDRLARQADLTKYSTLDAVEDFDAVRRWLGYDRINVGGGSYGSRVVLEYLRRHGDRVRTATLVAPVPPDFKRPLYYGRDALAALRGIVAACKLDAVCRRAFPDPLSQLDAVLQRLQREPASVAWKHPKTGAPIQIRIDRRMFSEIIWMILMGREAWKLPFIIARADSRDFTPLLEHGFMIGWLPMQASIAAMYLSVTCPEDTLRIAASDIGPDTPDFLGSDRLTRQMNACRAWPKSDLPADLLEPVRTSVPAFIVTGSLDPVAPTRWGQRLLDSMPNARLIDVPGMNHDLSAMENSIPCIVGLNFSFWNAGTAVGLDTSCVGTMKPPAFFVPSREADHSLRK